MLAFQYSICIISLICTGTKINNFLMLLTLCISGPVLVNSFCLLWFNFHTWLIFFPLVLENPFSCTHTMYMTIPKNNRKTNNYNLFSHTRSSILPPPRFWKNESISHCLNSTTSQYSVRLNFTITEQILQRWLVERYGLWECTPWKWPNMSRGAGCFVLGFS